MNTEIRKGAYGWYAETLIPTDNNKHIQIFTMKRYDGYLTTTAKAVIRNGDAWIYDPLTDKTTILVDSKPARITQKVVATQHQKALEIINQ